jgi:hypothetical protein
MKDKIIKKIKEMLKNWKEYLDKLLEEDEYQPCNQERKSIYDIL